MRRLRIAKEKDSVTRFVPPSGGDPTMAPAFAEELFVVNIHGTDDEVDLFMDLMDKAQNTKGLKLDRIYDQMDALVQTIKGRI